jgi:hypothetical protein
VRTPQSPTDEHAARDGRVGGKEPAHGTQRLVERVDFVTRDLFYRSWLQGLLNLLSRELLGLELRVADQFRCEGCVLDAEFRLLHLLDVLWLGKAAIVNDELRIAINSAIRRE